MNPLPYLWLFLCGAGFYVLFSVWRAARGRGEEGSALVKQLTKGFLAVGGLGLSVCALSQAPPDAMGPAALALVAGAAAPGLFLRRKRAAEAAEGDDAKADKAAKKGLKAVKTDVKPGKPKPNALVTKALRAAAPKVPSYLNLGAPVPVAAETSHFLVAGAGNLDKAAALGEVLEKLRARGDTAIVVDAGGDLLARHFAEDTDFVFNLYDERCVSWSPLRELQGAWDAPALARSIVPDGIGEERYPNALAQEFVDAVLRMLADSDKLTPKDFLYWTRAASLEELQRALDGSAAASGLGSERALSALRSTLTRYLASYDCLLSDGEPFSVAEMIRAEHSGVLFATYRADQVEAFRHILASLLDVAARTVLSLEPSAERRVWLIVDDAASLGRIQSLEAFTTRAQKAGGCLVLGVQALAPLSTRYDASEMSTVLAAMANRLVFRCADGETAEPLARLLGDDEELASSLQALQPLHGMLKLVGDQPAGEVLLPKSKQAEVTKAFEARDFRRRPMLKLAPAKPTAAPAPVERVVPAEPVEVAAPVSAPAPTREPEPTPTPARHATRKLLREDPLEARETFTGDDVEDVAMRARKTQEALRQQAEALGIAAWTQGEYDDEVVDEDADEEPVEDDTFVPVFAAVPVRQEEPLDESVPSLLHLSVAGAVEEPEATAQPEPVVLAVDVEAEQAPALEAVAPEVVEEVVEEVAEAAVAEAASARAAEAPLVEAATRPALPAREPRPAQRPQGERQERREGPGRQDRPQRQRQPAAPVDGTPAPATVAEQGRGAPKPREGGRNNGNRGGSGANGGHGPKSERPNKGGRTESAPVNKPAAPKGGKAHDMLKDLLR